MCGACTVPESGNVGPEAGHPGPQLGWLSGQLCRGRPDLPSCLLKSHQVPLGTGLVPGVCTGGMRGLLPRHAGIHGRPSLLVGH